MQLPPGASLERTDAVVRRATEPASPRPTACSPWPLRRPRRRHLHQRHQRRPRCSSRFQPLRGPRQEASDGRSTILSAVREASRQIQEAHRPRVQPAAGARPRHGGRLQDADPGPWRPRLCRARRTPPGMMVGRQPDARASPTSSPLFEASTPQVFAGRRPRQGRCPGVPVTEHLRGPARLSRARPTSTTSTSSAAPTASPPRPTRPSARPGETSASLRVRSVDGQMVPLGSRRRHCSEIAGPDRVPRYNLLPRGRAAGRTPRRA